MNIFRKYLALLFITALAVFGQSLSASEAQERYFKKEIVPLLDKYCYRCHDADVQKGDFRLDVYKNAAQLLPNRQHWLKVLEQLETEEMPTKKPLPSAAEYEKLIHWIDSVINKIDWSKIKEPGHVTIPLLTNEEYFNTINDSLKMDIRSYSKFSDDSEGMNGFTNDRDGLFVSTSKMEKYLDSAESIADTLVAVSQKPQVWKFEAENMLMTESKEKPTKKDNFHGYVLSRGQMSLYESIDIPYDGYYEVTVHARPFDGKHAATDLRIDNELRANFDTNSANLKSYTKRLKIAKGTHQFAWNIAFSPTQTRDGLKGRKPSSKEFKKARTRANANVMKFTDSEIKIIEKTKFRLKGFQQILKAYQNSIEALKVLGKDGLRKQIVTNYRVAFKSMNQVNTFLKGLDRRRQQKEYNEPVVEQFRQANAKTLKENARIVEIFGKLDMPSGKNVGIDWVEVRGPFQEANRKNEIVDVLRSQLGSSQKAKTVLTELLPKLFRRPLQQQDLDKYMGLYELSVKRGESFEDALKASIVAALISPRFLFRDELKKADKAYALDDYQLASRLSYFLWVSAPDAELLSLAAKGKLRQPQVLKQQISRMLKDPRSRRFIEAFSSEWLVFKSLGKSVMPDKSVFKFFTDDLIDFSKQETVLMIEDLFLNGGSLLSLIDSDYSFMNEALAKHYNRRDVSGPEFRKVKIKDKNRGGLLGMASILTATSNPTRTNPVNRGLFIYEKLFGAHMAPAPADAPALPENAGASQGVTLREEFEQHRSNPSCANCHKKIDPLGFGLENFDAIGKYRQRENGELIDASGEMPDGSKFKGVYELKKYILSKKKKEFISNISKRLLAFSLGRKLQYFDEPAIQKIVAAVEKDDYNSTTLLHEVIMSFPFRNQSNNGVLK